MLEGGGRHAAGGRRRNLSLSALLSRTLEPFDLGRFDIDCEGAAQVPPDAAAAVCLVVHELATNAVKHGALSGDGRVHVHCHDRGGESRLEWREAGGPKVLQPKALGFGDRLLRMALAPHGGSATRHFEPGGVVCEIAVPAPRLKPGDRPQSKLDPPCAPPDPLTSRRDSAPEVGAGNSPHR